MLNTNTHKIHSVKQSSAELTDEELVERIGLHKDRNALENLYNRYKGSLGAFLMRRLNNQKLVDEVFNDVMFTVWNKADSFKSDSKVSTWIFGIAYRQGLSLMRKESKHEHIDFAELDELPQKNVAALDEELHIALNELNEKHRVVIELAYYLGHSITEISDIIDCPTNTVKTRLFHARQHLKENLKQQTYNNAHRAL